MKDDFDKGTKRDKRADLEAVDKALLALVKLLARQAAEADYRTYLEQKR